MDALELIGQAFWNAFQMAWEVWWALVLGFDGERVCQLGVMGRPARRHAVLEDGRKRALGQVLIDHGQGSSWRLSDLSSLASRGRVPRC